jgi:hypothetical protein
MDLLNSLPFSKEPHPADALEDFTEGMLPLRRVLIHQHEVGSDERSFLRRITRIGLSDH